MNSVQSVGEPLFAWLVHLRQVHPLKLHPCNLWEALCCCGGKDTSATIFRTQTICVDLCNLWETIPNSSFCEFCEICGRSSSASRSNPWEPLLSHHFSPRYKYCVLFRAAHGAWADGCRDGADRCRGRISCAIALKTLQ